MRASVIHSTHDSPVRKADLMHGWGQNSCRIWRFTWGEIEEETMLSHGLHAKVFQPEIFAILACARKCIGRNYIREEIYICSDS